MLMLEKFFRPKSVAIIGASKHPNKVGHVILWNFIRGFKGKIYPVNPTHDEVLGLKCYKRVTDIPGHVDLAVIAIPARFVPEALKDCGKKGIKHVIIVSGGFSEIGRTDLEDEVKGVAKKYGIRIIGPNCIGVFDAYSQVDTLFMPRYRLERPRKGGISFISQSGAVGSAILDWAAARGFGFSKFVSYGNACDVDEVDLLNYMEKDRSTRVIGMYIEGTRRGRELYNSLRRITRKKPVIVIKGGKTSAGSKAASSHTGALAGSARVWDAMLKQSGAIIADDIRRMFNYSRLLAEQPLPKGKRVGIITNGGGFGVIASDALESHGLILADLKKETISEIKKHVPEYAVVKNPVDLVGDADAHRYEVALDALLKDENVDIILVLILFQTAGVQSEIIDIIASKSDKKEKPIIAFSAGGDFTSVHMRMLEKVGVPVFDSLEEASDAIEKMYLYSVYVGNAE